MRRKDFLTKGIIGLGGVVALTAFTHTSNRKNKGISPLEDCKPSPRETRGPFPNKTPAAYVRENIVGDRKGIPLLITLTVLDKNSECKPLPNALVDIWHCDNRGI